MESLNLRAVFYNIFLYLLLIPFNNNELGIKQLNVEPYDEDQGTGDLRYVLVNIRFELIT